MSRAVEDAAGGRVESLDRRLMVGLGVFGGVAVLVVGAYVGLALFGATFSRHAANGSVDQSDVAAARKYCSELPPSAVEHAYECWVGWYPNVPRDQLRTAAMGGIAIGMHGDLVRRVWGRPESINTTDHAGGHLEQWVYGSGRYAYLHDNVLTSFQDSR